MCQQMAFGRAENFVSFPETLISDDVDDGDGVGESLGRVKFVLTVITELRDFGRSRDELILVFT